MCLEAWLAGLLDGEGSMGVRLEHKPHRPHRPWYIVANVQMSTTSRETLDATLAALAELGIHGAGYTYQEKKPDRHLPSWHLRVIRLADIHRLAGLMLPYTVTKRRQWELIERYTASRIRSKRRPYTQEEVELAQALRDSNVRGAAAVRRQRIEEVI